MYTQDSPVSTKTVHGINIHMKHLSWPAQSPDLKIIKPLWRDLEDESGIPDVGVSVSRTCLTSRSYKG